MIYINAKLQLKLNAHLNLYSTNEEWFSIVIF
jgi:hypothetical protein